MEKINMKTLFVDFDGTTFEHATENILPGTKEKFDEWNEKGYTIIITTARPSSAKEETLRALDVNGLQYHAIIFDLPNGDRVVLNDIKEGRERAFAYNVARNGGVGHLDL